MDDFWVTPGTSFVFGPSCDEAYSGGLSSSCVWTVVHKTLSPYGGWRYTLLGSGPKVVTFDGSLRRVTDVSALS